MRICVNEHPRHAWPAECVNVKGRTVLDLGCGFFGMSPLFRQGKMTWDVALPDMISTAEHWLNLGASLVIGIDNNLEDIECLKNDLKGRNVVLLHEAIQSPEQVADLITRYNVDVLKADIEGFECHILDMKDEDFKRVKEYYIEAHDDNLVAKTVSKFKACNYKVREIMKLQNNGPDVFFAYQI